MPRTRPELVDLYRYPVPQCGRYKCLRLDKNESVSGYPESVVQEMFKGISPHFLAAYPEPEGIYRRIADLHELSVDQVAVTSGSEMAIRYLFEAYLDRGDEVVFLNPSFAMFEVYAKICGAEIIQVDFLDDLSIDVEDLIEKINVQTKIVAIANPNNPTGTVISESNLCRVADNARRNDAILLIDEAYYHFYGQSMEKYLSEYENLIITRTFSKACGLAAIRLGYALGDSDVIQEIKKLQPIDHANAFAIKLGTYILDHEELIWDYVARVQEGKVFVKDAFERLGFSVPDSRGNFVLIDVGDKQDLICEALHAQNILVGEQIRLPFPNHYIRITVGPIAEMKRVVEILDEVVQN